MLFPSSNLATAAQPWGRAVEKGINNLETLTATERVNNAARDAQAALSIKRLDASLVTVAAAAESANEAIAAITSLGSVDSAYTINAGNINAGTLTGINIIGATIKSADTGTRVEIAGTDVKFYYGTTMVGKLVGTNYSGSDSMAMLYQSSSNGIYLEPQGGTWLGPNGAIGLGTYGPYMRNSTFTRSASIDTTGLSVVGEIGTASQISGGSFYTAGSITGGSISCSSVTSSGAINSSGGNITTTNGLIIAGGASNGNVRASAQAGTGTVAANINNLGTIIRGSSSIRYKQDLMPLQLNIQSLLSLEPKTFRLIREVEELGDDAIRYPGLIAEDLDAAGLEEFVIYEYGEDGNLRPDNIRYAELSAALLIVIKDLSARIEALENK